MGFTWAAVRVRHARSSTLAARSGVPYVGSQAINYLQDQRPTDHKDIKRPPAVSTACAVAAGVRPCPVVVSRPACAVVLPCRRGRVPRPAVVAGALVAAGGVPWCWCPVCSNRRRCPVPIWPPVARPVAASRFRRWCPCARRGACAACGACAVSVRAACGAGGGVWCWCPVSACPLAGRGAPCPWCWCPWRRVPRGPYTFEQ